MRFESKFPCWTALTFTFLLNFYLVILSIQQCWFKFKIYRNAIGLEVGGGGERQGRPGGGGGWKGGRGVRS